MSENPFNPNKLVPKKTYEKPMIIKMVDGISLPPELKLEKDMSVAWDLAKKENFQRAGKVYEVPEEFPFLMHGTSLFNVEKKLKEGLRAKSGQQGEEETLPYVNREVVCFAAPKKIFNKFKNKSEYLFSNNAFGYKTSVYQQIHLIIKLPPKEKVMMWDVSGNHPHECRIDRDINPSEIYGIQPTNIKKDDGSLWGFFAQNNNYLFDYRPEYDQDKNLELWNQWPETVEYREALNEMILFLEQYDIGEKDRERAKELVSEFTRLRDKTKEIWLDYYRKAYKSQGHYIDKHKIIKFALEYYNEQRPEIHKRILEINDELKIIFYDVIKNKLNINPMKETSMDDYLDYLRVKYELEKTNYETIGGNSLDEIWQD